MKLRALLVLLCLLAGAVSAHEVRPAYLELRQTSAETYDVLWKLPARGPRGSDDPHCRSLCDPDRCAGPHRAPRRHDAVGRVTPDAPDFVVTAAASSSEVALTYLKLGVEHILLGIDHLLFVLALLILVQGTRKLVVTITAFTVAHSITLAGASLGLLNVPGAPVEACIALSIVFVATEIVHGRNGRPGLTARRPWIVAFAFGLLHGFGFAGALHEIGLPQTDIPLALLFFNVGVEVGQLVFIAAVLAVIGLGRRLPITLPAWAWRVPPYATGAVATFWLIERLVAIGA